ncbi:hypothetical protein Hamer_G015954 [Homarus americanus]|uniref:Uncharacterized protein n=1 Tax=Homarus americanus TaxID=6706 RepID=A0A8J5JLZ7_HOMAM|nr:hypothetical protein Hamer_G015954 [Homarus americanus]
MESVSSEDYTSGCSNEMLNQVMIWTCQAMAATLILIIGLMLLYHVARSRLRREPEEEGGESSQEREEAGGESSQEREETGGWERILPPAYEEAVDVPPPTYQEALAKMVEAQQGAAPPRSVDVCREDDPNLPVYGSHTDTSVYI